MSNAEIMEPLPTFPGRLLGTPTFHYPGLCFKAKQDVGFLQSSGGVQAALGSKLRC